MPLRMPLNVTVSKDNLQHSISQIRWQILPTLPAKNYLVFLFSSVSLNYEKYYSYIRKNILYSLLIT